MEVALWIIVCVLAAAGWVLLSLYVYWRSEALRWEAVAHRAIDFKQPIGAVAPSDPPTPAPAASHEEPQPQRWPL